MVLTDRFVQGVRKSISANVHVKAILSKLADELGGGAAEEGKRAATINLDTVYNIHKVMRNLEVTVKNAHVRVEEPAREVPVPLDEAETETETEVAAGRKPSTSTPAVAFGICLRGVSLGLDERADAGAGGGSGRERWFGKKFRAMETALLGNFCEIFINDQLPIFIVALVTAQPIFFEGIERYASHVPAILIVALQDM